MSNLILLIILVSLVGYWVYSLATYDWSKFDEDSEQAKKDLF